MARLLLLGGASLVTDDGPLGGRSAQRRRVALLAILAVERRPLVREKLIGWLWPETEQDRARRLLSESLYVIRKELGDVIGVNGEEVWLEATQLSSDVADFRAAIDDERWADAAALYAGPFLDGFFVPEAAELDHWIDARRDELARAYGSALEHVAHDAARRGDASAAADAWRRRATHDPYDGRVALALMHALVAAGNREAALQHARVHATLLKIELGAEPASDLVAYADELRASPTPATAPSAPAVPVVPVVPQHAIAASADEETFGPTPRVARARTRLATAALVVVLMAAGTALMASSLDLLGRPDAAATSDVTMVAVLPFTVRAAPEYEYLGDGLASLLGTSLNGAGRLRSVDLNALLSHPLSTRAADDDVLSPVAAGRLAADLGARHYVLGSLVETGGVFRITASLYEDGVETVQATVEGREVEIPALVDELGRQLLAARMTESDERLARVASLTTASLPALKAYLDGESDFRAARYRRAADSFARAIADDPTFALAHYRLSAAAAWSFDFMTAHRAAAAALAQSHRLSDHDQRLIGAWHAFIEGDANRAERLYESILTQNPHDVEAWAGLGEVRAHYNTVRGRPHDEARAAFERVLSVAPDYGEARFHMLEYAAAQGARAEFDSLLATLDPRNEQAAAWSAVRAIAWGSAAERERALERLRAEDEVIAGIAAARLAGNFRDFDGASRAAAVLIEPQRTADWRAAGHILLAQLAAARGDFDAAERQLDAALPLERDWALEMRGLFALHPARSADRQVLERARDELETWDPTATTPSMSFFFATHADAHAHIRLYLLALLELELGNEEVAERRRDELIRVGRSSDARALAAALAHSVDAHMEAAAGDPRAALAMLDEAHIGAPLERIALSSFFSQALDRHLRARMHESLGENEAAARWYGSLAEGPDIMFAADASRRAAALGAN